MDLNVEKEVKNKKRFIFIAGLAGQVTFMLVGPVLLCLFLGLWLDSFLNTSPLFIVTGVILGFTGSIYNVFKIMKIIDRM